MKKRNEYYQTFRTQHLKKLCKSHRVKSLYAFGSVLENRFNKESDIDFLVNFQEMEILDYADNYFNFLFALEDFFKRKIDLGTEKSLKNPYFIQEINQKKQLIYES